LSDSLLPPFRRIPDQGPGQAPEASLLRGLQKTWTPFFNGVTTLCKNIAIFKWNVFFQRKSGILSRGYPTLLLSSQEDQHPSW
jgi:hypothetical protein